MKRRLALAIMWDCKTADLNGTADCHMTLTVTALLMLQQPFNLAFITLSSSLDIKSPPILIRQGVITRPIPQALR